MKSLEESPPVVRSNRISLQSSPRSFDLTNTQKVEEIILSCNQFAIEHMKENGSADVLQLLKKSEYLLEKNVGKLEPAQRDRLLDMTYNNIGCYYKKQNKFSVALTYLLKVAELDSALEKEKIDQAATKLNICAILSSQNKHNLALEFAKTALKLVYSHIDEKLGKRDNESKGEDKMRLIDLTGERMKSEQKEESTKERLETQNSVSAQIYESKPDTESGNSAYSTLIIALYNVGVECEFLGRLREALACYMKAESILKNKNTSSDQMLMTIEKAKLDCQRKISQKQRYHHIRSKARSFKATSNFFNDKEHMKHIEVLKKTRHGANSSRMENHPQSPYSNFLLESRLVSDYEKDKFSADDNSSTDKNSKHSLTKPILEQRVSQYKLNPERVRLPLIAKSKNATRANSMSNVSPYLASARAAKALNINMRMAKFRVSRKDSRPEIKNEEQEILRSQIQQRKNATSGTKLRAFGRPQLSIRPGSQVSQKPSYKAKLREIMSSNSSEVRGWEQTDPKTHKYEEEDLEIMNRANVQSHHETRKYSKPFTPQQGPLGVYEVMRPKFKKYTPLMQIKK